MESEYKSRMETSTEILLRQYTNLLFYWNEEIKTDGVSFNFDSQDVHRESLNQINIHNLNRFTGNISPIEKKILGVLVWKVKQTINLYEANKVFFDNLNREWLILRAFKLNYSPEEYKDIPDDTLKVYLSGFKELSERSTYFKTDFYKNIGFLEINFHREIYFFTKILLSQIQNENTDYIYESGTLLYANADPIFSMKMIGELHPIINEAVIGPISDFDFFKEINYMHTFDKIKILKGNNNSFYYLVHKLSRTIRDDNEKERWVGNVLKDFDLKKDTYDSKYSYINNQAVGSNSKKLAEKLNKVFKAYEP